MKLLVSVRTPAEAAVAAAGGADFIDLKEPRGGALGGLPVATVREIVQSLRGASSRLPISATIGDLGMDDVAAILRQVDAVGGCGVDYVKVGIEVAPGAVAVLAALAAAPWPVVPVFIADLGLDFDLIGLALQGCFPAVMADTADKLAGSLFDAVPVAHLRRFVARSRSAGVLVGLAGALRLPHLPLLAELAPDFAGFRSAVCAGDRGSELDTARLRGLRDSVGAAVAGATAKAVTGRTSSSPG